MRGRINDSVGGRITNNGLQPVVVRRPFASPLAAQTWFEFRRNTVMIPCIAIAIALFMAVLTAKTGGKATPIPYGPFMFHPIYFAVSVALFRHCWPRQCMVRCSASRMLGRNRSPSPHFIAARPLSMPVSLRQN